MDANGAASVTLQYAKFDLEVSLDGQAPPPSPRLQRIVNNIGRLTAVLRVDHQGNLAENTADVRRVPPDAREVLKEMHEQIQHALEALAVPLPNRRVEVHEKWRAWRTLPIDTAGRFESGAMEMTYTYLGCRKRGGAEEAVIALDGAVRGRRGQEDQLGGRASGIAHVDLATGQVLRAESKVLIDLNTTLRDAPVKAAGTLEVRLERSAR